MKKTRLLSLTAISMLLLINSAFAKNSQQCQDLKQQLVGIQLKIDAIDREADFADSRQEKAQALADTLAASKAALDDAAGNADDVATKLTDLLKTVKQAHPNLKTFLEETAAGSEQFKGSLEKASTNISRAEKLLQAGIDASRANTQKSGAQALKAFNNYYQALLEPLSPLVDKVPGIGAFLTAYGEAINSAAIITGQLEAEIERRRKIGKELTGRDFYSFAKNNQDTYDKLTDEYDSINDQLDQLNCDAKAQASSDSEQIDVSDEQKKICIKKIGAPSDFFRQLTRRQRALDIAENQLTLDKLGLRLARSALTNAQFQLNRRENAIQSQKNIMKRELIAINNYLVLQSPRDQKSLQPPQFSPGTTNAYCGKILALDQFAQHRPTIKRYCNNALQRVKDEKLLSRDKATLASSKTAVETAKKTLLKAQTNVDAAKRKNQEAKQWDKAYLECIKNQKKVIKSCEKITLSSKPTACACDSSKSSSYVWGSYYYTSDSNICQAAKHIGAVPKSGGIAIVKQVPGRAFYNGSVRHTITSSDYGAFKNSIVFLGVEKPPEASDGKLCPFNLSKRNTPFNCLCRKSATSSSVYGSNPYTGDSSLCTAAKHSGVITDNGGLIRVIPQKGQKQYPASTRNKVTTSAWGEYDRSFLIKRVPNTNQ